MPHKNHDRLSWTDAVFLYLEREGVPLHIAGVSTMEGIVSLEDCRRFVESKIPQIPRYRQRVVAPLLNIGRPTWEFDPEFDIANHIQEISLKHGTEAEFKALSAKILSEVMDRQRPLWDITLVRGLKGNRTGFISRVHHCLADGMSGVGLMNAILDVKPTAPPASGKRPRFRVPPPRDPWATALDGWVSSYTSVVEQVLTTQAEILNIAERILDGRGIPDVDDLRKHLPELSVPTEPLHFNATCRGPQNVAWVEIPLADIKAVREACGCSVNDVALTLLTSSIRRYATRYGDQIKGKLLRIMVPVNTRGDSGTDGLGNQISILPVTVPLDIENPKKLVAAVHERTSFLKRSHVAELASLAGGLIGMLPTAWQALGGPIASQLPITPFNLVCTNVPGPPCALYLMGHRMLDWHPYVPIGGDMALNCAILSYNGTVFFGFTGDAIAAPGIAQLETLMKKSMQELQKALGIKASRKTVVRRKTAVAGPAAQVQSEEIKVPAAIAIAAREPSAEHEVISQEPEFVTAEVA